MNKLINAMYVVICALGAVGVNAADDDFDYHGNNWLLAKYDLNGDARITQDEITSKKLNIFRHMDNDGDGGVSFDEYENMDSAKRFALLKSRFAKLDSDHDGRVSEDEYCSYMGLFADIDSNGDGTLTSDEMNPQEEHEAQVTRCLWWFCLRTEAD